MKTSFLLAICSLMLLSCANKKNTTNDSNPKPQAELSLAPGHIQANLKILKIEDMENQKNITSEVLEILNYGSSTDPVPTGTNIKFMIDNELYNKSLNKFKQNSTLVAILSREGNGMMMGDERKQSLWKLITINN